MSLILLGVIVVLGVVGFLAGGRVLVGVDLVAEDAVGFVNVDVVALGTGGFVGEVGFDAGAVRTVVVRVVVVVILDVGAFVVELVVTVRVIPVVFFTVLGAGVFLTSVALLRAG